MYRYGLRPSGGSLRTPVQSVRGTTVAGHWNALDMLCDKEGGLPFRCERHRLCSPSDRE